MWEICKHKNAQKMFWEVVYAVWAKSNGITLSSMSKEKEKSLRVKMTWTQHERKLICSSELFFCNSEAETQLTYFGSKNIIGWLVYGYKKN